MDKIGQALVSVAEVKFYDPITDYELGSAFALTDSGISSDMQSAEVRGGFMNQLLFDIKHTRSFSINFTSATFKPVYLAFQTGTDIVVGAKKVYIFDDCVTATNGELTLSRKPVGPVNVQLPNGTMIDIATPDSETVNVGSGINGECICSYAYTNAQVSNISGTALSYTDAGSCGQQKYADWTFIPDTASIVSPIAIASVPSKISISTNGTITPTIYAIRGGLYSNELLTADLEFASDTIGVATVDASTGVIKGVSAGNANITVTYNADGLNLGTTIAVTVVE